MNVHEQLLAALHQQTMAMQELTKAVADLAQSNRDMVDYLAGQQDDGEEREPAMYLDGTRVRGGS